MLLKSRFRIKRLQVLGKIQSYIGSGKNGSSSKLVSLPSITDITLEDCKWLALITGNSPRLMYKLSTKSWNEVLQLGVARSPNCLCRSGKVSNILHVALDNSPHLSEWAREASIDVKTEIATPQDAVSLATNLTRSELIRLNSIMTKQDWPIVFRETVSLAQTVEYMITTPQKLQEVPWQWTKLLEDFFKEKSFRGIKRRAARILGTSLAREVDTRSPSPPPVWSSPPDSMHHSIGFDYFVAEWAIAFVKELKARMVRENLHSIKDRYLKDAESWIINSPYRDLREWWKSDVQLMFN